MSFRSAFSRFQRWWTVTQAQEAVHRAGVDLQYIRTILQSHPLPHGNDSALEEAEAHFLNAQYDLENVLRKTARQ